MDHINRWTVIIDTDEHDGRTRAVARLLTRDSDRLVGIASAHPDGPGRDLPAVGTELAAAGALAELARKLRDTAHADIEAASVTTADVGVDVRPDGPCAPAGTPPAAAVWPDPIP